MTAKMKDRIGAVVALALVVIILSGCERDYISVTRKNYEQAASYCGPNSQISNIYVQRLGFDSNTPPKTIYLVHAICENNVSVEFRTDVRY